MLIKVRFYWVVPSSILLWRNWLILVVYVKVEEIEKEVEEEFLKAKSASQGQDTTGMEWRVKGLYEVLVWTMFYMFRIQLFLPWNSYSLWLHMIFSWICMVRPEFKWCLIIQYAFTTMYFFVWLVWTMHLFATTSFFVSMHQILMLLNKLILH